MTVSTAVAEGGARGEDAGSALLGFSHTGDTGNTLPGFSYTVRTAAKGSDQLMTSVCRTSTNWRFCRSTSFLSIAASSLAPTQPTLGVAAASVSPQLQGRLASTIARHDPVLGVALPRQRQRHDRSADPRPSAEHECRRAEQGEQRWASRLTLGKRRLREVLVGAQHLDLWKAKVVVLQKRKDRLHAAVVRRCGLGLSSIA